VADENVEDVGDVASVDGLGHPLDDVVHADQQRQQLRSERGEPWQLHVDHVP
jgi:hypothetical protein